MYLQHIFTLLFLFYLFSVKIDEMANKAKKGRNEKEIDLKTKADIETLGLWFESAVKGIESSIGIAYYFILIYFIYNYFFF